MLRGPGGDREARSPGHILVVNASAALRDLFRDILEQHGYRVWLSSVPPAQAAIRRRRPDLILLDPTAGGETAGRAFLARLEVDPATATIPVVACSTDVSAVRRWAECWRRT